MRAFQFWILLLGSFVVSVLMIKHIFLEREINKARAELVDSQETANTGPAFENAWKQLAMRVFEDSRQDTALNELLKKDGVQVRANPAADGTNQAPSASAPPLPMVPPKISTAPTSPKTTTSPLHPATH